MQIVIDIPEDIVIDIKDYCGMSMADAKKALPIILNAIHNGTALPKGHGRILDEKDILDTENNSGGWYDLVDMPEYIAGVKAIIEADTESEVEK